MGQISQNLEWPLKIIGIFNMWAGRLEIYPVLITFRAFFEVLKDDEIFENYSEKLIHEVYLKKLIFRQNNKF